MQKHDPVPALDLVTPEAPIRADTHGGRAKCLQRLMRLGLPVPQTVALPFRTVRMIAAGHQTDVEGSWRRSGRSRCCRCGPPRRTRTGAGPARSSTSGMNDARRASLAGALGEAAADALYLRFIRAYAERVAHLEAEEAAAWETRRRRR